MTLVQSFAFGKPVVVLRALFDGPKIFPYLSIQYSLMRTLIQLIIIGLLIMCFSRCSTPEKLISKAMAKDPAAVAKATRDLFPCTDLLKADTAMVFRDSLIYIDCPDTTRNSPYEVTVYDTATRVVTKTIRIPVTVRLPAQVITRWYEDSAKIFLLHKDVQRLQADTAQLRASRDEWRGKAKHRATENWIWRAIATVLIFIFAIRLWKRLTTIKLRA